MDTKELSANLKVGVHELVAKHRRLALDDGVPEGEIVDTVANALLNLSLSFLAVMMPQLTEDKIIETTLTRWRHYLDQNPNRNLKPRQTH
jgi:hypothetical protein